MTTTYHITVTTVRDPIVASHPHMLERDAAYRLRLALKALLRGFGLKCIRVSEQPNQHEHSNEDTPHAE